MFRSPPKVTRATTVHECTAVAYVTYSRVIFWFVHTKLYPGYVPEDYPVKQLGKLCTTFIPIARTSVCFV